MMIQSVSSCCGAVKMDSEFEILYAYVRSKKQCALEEKKKKKKKKEIEESEEVCYHREEQVEHAGHRVCSQCGFVMADIYMPEVKWRERCTSIKTYTDSDRIQGVNRHLVHFLNKIDFTLPHAQFHPVQEALQAMKKSSSYKSMNYAIALSCILHEDHDAVRTLRSSLPRSNVSWLRSSRITQPLPSCFPLMFLLHLMEHIKGPLSARQLNTLKVNLSLMSPADLSMMHLLIDAYCWHDYSLEYLVDHVTSLPPDLANILYQFTKTAVRHQC